MTEFLNISREISGINPNSKELMFPLKNVRNQEHICLII